MAKGKRAPKWARTTVKTRQRGVHFCHLLREMAKDEKKANKTDYPKLLEASKNVAWMFEPPARFDSDIQGIIKDEGRHHGIIDGYYRYVCGKQH